MRTRVALALALLTACAGSPPPEVKPTPPPSAASPISPADAGPATSSPGDAGAPVDAGAPLSAPRAFGEQLDDKAAEQALKDRPPPPPAVARTGKQWPFHTWDKAVFVQYNHFPAHHLPPLDVYDDKGWTPFLFAKRDLTADQGKRALALVAEMKGRADVSKCPFPRHGVVFLEGDVPVASVSVCFECGDILVWPEWTPGERARREKRSLAELEREGKQMLLRHDKVFPKWKAFLEKDLGVSPSWRKAGPPM